MFGTIRKHQTWLWFIIIGVMVVSMATFVQMDKSKSGRGGAGGLGSIDGKPITDAEYQNAWNEVALLYFFRTHEFPDAATSKSGWNQEQQTYQRIFLIRKLEQFNIRTDKDSVAEFAGLFLRELGRGENVPLEQFEAQILRPHNLTAEDFRRFLEHDLSIQQLISIVGASGKLIPPSEIEALYKQEFQQVKAQAVVFSASNYVANIPEPTPTVLGQFYTNRESQYREPDRMQLSYVRFNITNYLADAQKAFGTNLNSQTEEAFRHLGTNAFNLGKTEEEQKTKIGELLVRGIALSNAYNTAVSFQKELTSKENPHVDDLNTLAKQKGMEVKVSKPFDKDYGPSDLMLPSSVPAASLFSLTADAPFADIPIKAEDGVYILAFNKSIPSRVPPLEEIHSRVIADFKNFEATQTAQMNARLFEQVATNGLAKGQTFAEILSGAKVKTIDLAPFSASSETVPEVEDEVDLNTFKQNVITTPTGKVSGLIPTHSGGMLVYVRERLPIDQEKMKAEMPKFTRAVQQQRESQAFNLWFEKEASAGLRDIPALQQQRRS